MFNRFLNNFINKLKKHLQIDIRYYIKNIAYLIGARGVNMVCALLLSILFARFLSQETYGKYNFILALLGVLSVFTLTGMGMAISQAVANGYDKVLITGTREKLKWSILGSVATFGIGVFYFLIGSSLLGKCFMISSLFFPFLYNFHTFSDFLAGKKKFDKVAKYNNITKIISLVSLAPVIYFSGNLIHIIIAYLVVNSLLGAYFFKLTLKKIKNQSDDKKAISFGKHLSLINIIRTIAGQFDKIIIGSLLGFSDLAVYSIALAIPQSISGTTSFVSSVTFPKLSVKTKKEAYSAVRKRYFYLIIFASIIAGIIILVCPHIIPLFYSEAYLKSIFYAQLLSLDLIFMMPTRIFVKALFPAQRETGKLFRFRMFFSIVQLTLLFVLALTFGVLGVVLAKLLGDMFAMFYSFRLATQR